MMVVGSRQSSNDCIFHLRTLFPAKTDGVRDLKSDTSAYRLKRLLPSQSGIKRTMFFPFFLSFFCYSLPLRSTLLIKDHAYSPKRVLQHYNCFSTGTALWGPSLFLIPFPLPSFHVLPTPRHRLRSRLPPSLHLYLQTSLPMLMFSEITDTWNINVAEEKYILYCTKCICMFQIHRIFTVCSLTVRGAILKRKNEGIL